MVDSKYAIRWDGFLKDDKTLKILDWAFDRGFTRFGVQILHVDMSEREQHMAHSHATGEGLVTNGLLGADVIRLGAGEGFVPHTHPGDHLLIVIGGKGTITYDGKIYPTHAGQIYLIRGEVPHAVGAITDHVILAVGSPHKAVDDPTRMKPVEYQEVAVEIGMLHCLICDKQATLPQYLHEVGCGHCPCYDCMDYEDPERHIPHEHD